MKNICKKSLLDCANNQLYRIIDLFIENDDVENCKDIDELQELIYSTAIDEYQSIIYYNDAINYIAENGIYDICEATKEGHYSIIEIANYYQFEDYKIDVEYGINSLVEMLASYGMI